MPLAAKDRKEKRGPKPRTWDQVVAKFWSSIEEGLRLEGK
jgi:hypothetical protein